MVNVVISFGMVKIRKFIFSGSVVVINVLFSKGLMMVFEWFILEVQLRFVEWIVSGQNWVVLVYSRICVLMVVVLVMMMSRYSIGVGLLKLSNVMVIVLIVKKFIIILGKVKWLFSQLLLMVLIMLLKLSVSRKDSDDFRL